MTQRQATSIGPEQMYQSGSLAVDPDAAVVDPGAPFGSPEPVSELNTPLDEDDPSLTSDQLLIFFERTSDIFSASRSSTAEPWSAPALVAELSSASDESGPFISADGLTIHFTSNRPGGQGDLDIWVAHRRHGHPHLLHQRPQRRGGGGRDLWFASRPAVNQEFDPPVPLVGINSPANETDPWLSEDLRTLYFSRDDDLYVARR